MITRGLAAAVLLSFTVLASGCACGMRGHGGCCHKSCEEKCAKDGMKEGKKSCPHEEHCPYIKEKAEKGSAEGEVSK